MSHLLPSLTIALALALPPVVASAVTSPPFKVKELREICNLPRPNNNGRVMGHDNGSSATLNGTTYWFFADTILDGLQSLPAIPGQPTPTPAPFFNDGLDKFDAGIPQGFETRGTVAKTTDGTGNDCLSLQYSADANGLAKPLFPDFSKSYFTWPGGAVVADPSGTGNSRIYIYAYTSQTPETFLARFDTQSMTASKVASFGNPELGFTEPVSLVHSDQSRWIYLIGGLAIHVDAPGSNPTDKNATSYRLARVREVDIENPSKYQYYAGPTVGFASSPSSAAELFKELASGPTGFLTYSAALRRYLVVYSCLNGSAVCARASVIRSSDIQTALGLPLGLPQPTPSASWWPWANNMNPADKVVLIDCTANGSQSNLCYAVHNHAELGRNALFLTTAENPDNCYSSQFTYDPVYGLTLYRVKLNHGAADSLAPFYLRTASEYNPQTPCEIPAQGANGWSYASSSFNVLTPLTFRPLWQWSAPQLPPLGPPVPLINPANALPGDQTAARIWQPNYSGDAVVTLSGEVRKIFSCGDEVVPEIVRIRNGKPVEVLWSPPPLGPKPEDRVRQITVTQLLLAGDGLGFRVRNSSSGASGPETWWCDHVRFAPTIKVRARL